MRDGMRGVFVAALLALVLTSAAGCSSDEDGGGSAFRNLGKRGDSSVTNGHASAALK